MFPHPARTSIRPAFTLIELLVVISIIALLIGILLPTLSSARNTARVLRCGTQLQQLGRAMATYTNDFDDYFTGMRGRRPGASGNKYSWDDALMLGGYDGRSLSMVGLTAAQLSQAPVPAESEPGMYLCPLDDFVRTLQTGVPRSYGINQWRIPPQNANNMNRGISGFINNSGPDMTGGFSRRVSDVTQGSNTIMFYDNVALPAGGGTISQNVLSDHQGVGVYGNSYHPLQPAASQERGIVHHALNAGGAGSNAKLVPNFVYTDGHVANLLATETYIDNTRASGYCPQFNTRRTMWDAKQ